ncbi:MAG: peptidoglycan-binding protein [Xanthobacteraceae bacterium]
MNARVASLAASLAVSLLMVAGATAFARQATKSAATKPAHVTHAEAPSAKGTASAKGAAAAKSTHAALPPALAAIPEADRLAIQADLAWLGHFEGLSAEEIGARTLDAIKAFQRRNGGKETGVLSDQERVSLAEAARPHEATVGWRLIDDSATGARVGVPEKLAPRASTARTGSRWTSPLGQVQIESFGLHDASLPALFEQEKKTSQRQVAYSALEPDSFVIIGEQHLKKFVVRAQSSGSEVRGVTILYDQATEGTMASVAVAIADTFAGFPDASAGTAMGHKRGVEYGSAIVVSNTGDLLSTAAMTDECQSITVPGVGHADRVAIDKANDLALLRLYGARNLVAAALSSIATSATDLTLFGAADPLAQAGNGSVRSAAAELTAQGIVPAPSPGFSGAAALDGQGRFAGIVALKSAIVAGAGPTGPQAALVPAAAVRAFLAAQGIAVQGIPTPGTATTGIAITAGNATMDQSVVRLIRVRK